MRPPESHGELSRASRFFEQPATPPSPRRVSGNRAPGTIRGAWVAVLAAKIVNHRTRRRRPAAGAAAVLQIDIARHRSLGLLLAPKPAQPHTHLVAPHEEQRNEQHGDES